MPTQPGPVTEDYSEDLSEDRISPAAGIRHGYRRPSQHQTLKKNATRDKVHPEELQLAEGERGRGFESRGSDPGSVETKPLSSIAAVLHSRCPPQPLSSTAAVLHSRCPPQPLSSTAAVLYSRCPP
ncbi:unnamed protein product [Arctogadus glacialis]